MTAPIVITLVALLAAGSAAVIALSARLRAEIQELLAAFGRTEPALMPIVATVRTDRERLARRLAELSEGGSDPDAPRR